MKGLLRNIGIGIIIGFILLIVDQLIRYFNSGSIDFSINFFLLLGFYIMYSVPLCLVNAYFFDYVYHKVKWERFKKYRYILGFLGSVVVTVTTLFVIRAFHRTGIEQNSWEQFLNTERVEFYYISIAITLAISLIFHAFFFYKEQQKNKIKEQKVIAGTASAKFDALKNQLDPHFLFNSLNVLSSLIDENPESAQDFTTALSKVYRYVLEQKNKDLVTVDEELKFAK
ncbi:MAG: histidine kinase, partial [Bacteroidia bacterium]|nr:histidine kinase [Bacteroidia bacterium]